MLVGEARVHVRTSLLQTCLLLRLFTRAIRYLASVPLPLSELFASLLVFVFQIDVTLVVDVKIVGIIFCLVCDQVNAKSRR